MTFDLYRMLVDECVNSSVVDVSEGGDTSKRLIPGISKREFFAIAFAQCFARNEKPEACATLAVRFSDALIDELDT